MDLEAEDEPLEYSINNPTNFSIITDEPMGSEPLVPPEIFVRPCIDGNSTTGHFFNFSLISECTSTQNCSLTNKQPGAFFLSPILLSLAGISGQIWALIYLHRSQRRKNHKTVFYVMLATLIWTDLIGKLLTTPVPVITYAVGHFVGGKHVCNVHGYAMSLIGMETHLLVAIMALERIIGVTDGYFYARVITTTRTRFLLIGTWIFSMIFCIFPLFNVGEFKLHYPGTWCHINQHPCADDPLVSTIYGNVYSGIILTCLIIMATCNLFVVGTLLKMRVNTVRLPQVEGTKKPPRGRLKEREIQMVILLLIITVVFIFSWAPHDVLMFRNQISPPPPFSDPYLDLRAIRLVSLNQILDPWAYIISRMIFRSKLWKSCRKRVFGRMITRTDSGRKNSILSAFSITSTRKNSRASPYKDQPEIFSEEESAPINIFRRKKSQVQFDIREESSSTTTSQGVPTFFKKSESLRHRLRYTIPRAISSFLNRPYSSKYKDKETGVEPASPQDSSKNGVNRNASLPSFVTNEYSEQIWLLKSSVIQKDDFEQKLAQCLSPYNVATEKIQRRTHNNIGGVTLMSLHGRSNSWCGSPKNSLGELHRSHSMETIGKEHQEI